MEKPVYFSEDRELLRDLYTYPAGRTYYYFHERYMLSPAQLARSLQRFSADNIITLDEELVLLSDFGKRWVLANRHSIFLVYLRRVGKIP
jgi:hypothetical protein